MIRPALGGTMNLGILSLAVPTQNFAQRRQDADRALQFQMLSAQQAEQDRVKLQQEVAAQRQKMQQVRSLSLLAPDQNRVNMVADELEKTIKDKIKTKYGGNLKKYLEEGADADYEEYINTIRNSDAYADGNYNKLSMAQYLEDQKAGKIPMMVNGRPVNDIMSDFQTGRVRRFDYMGAYAPPKDYAKRIQDSYGKDRFTKEAADPGRVLLELQQDGLTAKQAIDYYQQAGLGINPIYYKSDDMYDKQKMEEESALRRARLAAIGRVGQPKAQKADFDAMEALKTTVAQTRDRTFEGVPTKVSVSNPLSKYGTDAVMGLANGRFDEKSGYHVLQRGQTVLTADGLNQIQGVTHVYNPRVVTVRDPSDPNNPQKDRIYLQVDGMMTEGDAEMSGSLKSIDGKKAGSVESFFSNDEQIGGSALVNKAPWYKLGFGTGPEGFKYEVKDLLIPIGDKTKLENYMFNKDAGISQKDYNPVSYEDNIAFELYQ